MLFLFNIILKTFKNNNNNYFYYKLNIKIIATDQVTLENELIIKKKLSILFNLIVGVHGPLIEIDRVNKYNKFDKLYY